MNCRPYLILARGDNQRDGYICFLYSLIILSNNLFFFSLPSDPCEYDLFFRASNEGGGGKNKATYSTILQLALTTSFVDSLLHSELQ